jgi:hypothetical protein
VFGREIPHGQSVLKDTKTRLCSIPVSAVGDGVVRVRALSESMEPNEVILTAVKRRPETAIPKCVDVVSAGLRPDLQMSPDTSALL